ncbi:hypothetical protein PMIN01_04623 [Paraphaeosphaeria minitans]|uniref:Uncharacterized protein n=1 Tax=Paraphaeosphaeria minitans TaxID=565426 RepID=A0A9P6GK20_9PLEO|nr:hypothetical protein PMIN01_04623 [Paraphaeosphaeria minitans]
MANIATGPALVFGAINYKVAGEPTYFTTQEVKILQKGIQSGRITANHHMAKGATHPSQVMAIEDADENVVWQPGYTKATDKASGPFCQTLKRGLGCNRPVIRPKSICSGRGKCIVGSKNEACGMRKPTGGEPTKRAPEKPIKHTDKKIVKHTTSKKLVKHSTKKTAKHTPKQHTKHITKRPAKHANEKYAKVTTKRPPKHTPKKHTEHTYKTFTRHGGKATKIEEGGAGLRDRAYAVLPHPLLLTEVFQATIVILVLLDTTTSR